MKILNLYAGIGGNRKLWGDDHDITAVEIDEEIADIYSDFFREDEMIVGDAHEYLLENFEDYDFIWSSPPCPTHSKARNLAGVGRGQNEPIYPDMELYEEILFLKRVYETKGTDFEGSYVVENVKSYYEPLVPPQEIGKHYFWSNFYIPAFKIESSKHHSKIKNLEERKGLNLDEYDIDNKKQILRNCVEPELGKHILDYATGKIEQGTLM